MGFVWHEPAHDVKRLTAKYRFYEICNLGNRVLNRMEEAQWEMSLVEKAQHLEQFGEAS